MIASLNFRSTRGTQAESSPEKTPVKTAPTRGRRAAATKAKPATPTPKKTPAAKGKKRAASPAAKSKSPAPTRATRGGKRAAPEPVEAVVAEVSPPKKSKKATKEVKATTPKATRG